MAFKTSYVHFQTCLLEMLELKNIIKEISLKIVDDPNDGLVLKEKDYEYYIRKFYNSLNSLHRIDFKLFSYFKYKYTEL